MSRFYAGRFGHVPCGLVFYNPQWFQNAVVPRRSALITLELVLLNVVGG
jgi:hypothetical protein